MVGDNVVDVSGKYHTYNGNARYIKCPMPWCFDELAIMHIYQNAVVPGFTSLRHLSPLPWCFIFMVLVVIQRFHQELLNSLSKE